MISSTDVLDILSALEGAGLSVWLDGGWGVDALLREQTRPHDDLDLVVRLEHTDAAIAVLTRIGFRLDVDARPTRFVVADECDRRIDFHPVVFDEDGSASQIGAGAGDGDAVYPVDGFRGMGKVAGRNVTCLTPELLVRQHQGYKPEVKDRHNVRLLCERFNIPLPPAYR